MSESKFKPGDRVRVIKYGHPMWTTIDGYKSLVKSVLDHQSNLLFGKPSSAEVEDPIILNDDNGYLTIDGSPELVGQIGVIEGSYLDLYAKYCGKDEESIERNKHQYSILGIPGKSAWYDEGQLEIVN